ncbi:MAG: SH3 domain-containing protein [Desulfomonilaceae bacterium]|nr:SH3 domain-containing protein [Desulfomonilaceae bacterium]
MYYRHTGMLPAALRPAVLTIVLCLPLFGGCQEADTLVRELRNKFNKVVKPKTPFEQKDGLTIRTCSLYVTANPNSEVIRRLPSETPVRLLNRIGEYYRVRTRDGREGYLEEKVVGGEEIIIKTQQLRRSIEGLPPQAEGITKSRANFRLDPGREQQVIEVLPPGKRFEVFERHVTLRPTSDQAPQESVPIDDTAEDAKKDVWYKVKMEDGRVGFIYTYNMRLVPPDEIARAVPFMRMVAWKTVNVIDDQDLGAKNNYIVAYAPIGKDAGCDYTRLYLMAWSSRLKRRVINWQLGLKGILPITSFQFEGKPGFSVRYLHPAGNNKLVLASFVFAGGKVRKVSEEEIPNPSKIH